MKDRRNGTPSGNVRHEAAPETAVESQDIKAGDIVSVTGKVLQAKGVLAKMSPRLLIDIGWPNEFLVLKTFETEKDGFCLKLEPCCEHLVEDWNTGRPRCYGHHAFLFKKVGSMNPPKKETEPVEVEPPRNPGDRISSVSLPFLGEVASMSYREDEQNPQLTINTAGKATVLTGPLAKLFAAAAKENNLL